MTLKYQHLPLQEFPKFTQIWIFGLKIYHMAALLSGRRGGVSADGSGFTG
jgi:hypothetical protein